MKKGMKKLATTLLAALLMITQLPAVESKDRNVRKSARAELR